VASSASLNPDIPHAPPLPRTFPLPFPFPSFSSPPCSLLLPSLSSLVCSRSSALYFSLSLSFFSSAPIFFQSTLPGICPAQNISLGLRSHCYARSLRVYCHNYDPGLGNPGLGAGLSGADSRNQLAPVAISSATGSPVARQSLPRSSPRLPFLAILTLEAAERSLQRLIPRVSALRYSAGVPRSSNGLLAVQGFDSWSGGSLRCRQLLLVADKKRRPIPLTVLSTDRARFVNRSVLTLPLALSLLPIRIAYAPHT